MLKSTTQTEGLLLKVSFIDLLTLNSLRFEAGKNLKCQFEKIHYRHKIMLQNKQHMNYSNCFSVAVINLNGQT